VLGGKSAVPTVSSTDSGTSSLTTTYFRSIGAGPWNTPRCKVFLLKCDLNLARYDGAVSGRDRVATVISALTGWALDWGAMVWETGGPEVEPYEHFTLLFRSVFDHHVGREEGERLLDFARDLGPPRSSPWGSGPSLPPPDGTSWLSSPFSAADYGRWYSWS
jgi:hypothetical protein